MNTSTAVSATVAITLATTGAVSALFLTMGSGFTSANPVTDPAQDIQSISIEYVDENGNPVADPTAATRSSADGTVPSLRPIIETEYHYVETPAELTQAPNQLGDTEDEREDGHESNNQESDSHRSDHDDADHEEDEDEHEED